VKGSALRDATAAIAFSGEEGVKAQAADINYTPAPGGRVRISAHRTADGVEVAVEDTGPESILADLTRIWEPLYRGDHSRSVRGLGIGLSLVWAIVEAHRKRASVESTPGRGSRFSLWLPAGQQGRH
jgi:signal transduction histidine kinase